MTDDKTLDTTTNIRTMDTQAMPAGQAAEQAEEQAAADKGFDDSRNHSLQDIVDTQAMPAPAGAKPDVAPPTEQVLDKPIPAADQTADTAVLAETEATAGTAATAKSDATAKDDSAAKDDATQPVSTPFVDLNTPLTRLMGVSDDEPEPETKPGSTPEPTPSDSTVPSAPTQPAVPAQPTAAVPATIAPTGPSVPTILFGVIGILVGAFGLLLGLRLPDVTTWMVAIDPQTLTALFFGGIGVVLILVAIIWAIAKAVTGRNKQ